MPSFQQLWNDHIDLWDGRVLRGGNSPAKIAVAEAVWFWQM